MTPRPLRVVYVTSTLTTGGCERTMLGLAEGLPKDRFQIEFLLLTEPGPLAPAFEAAGARVRAMGSSRRSSRLHTLRWVWDAARLAAELRRGHYDIADAWLFHAYAATALVRPVAGVPVMISGRHFMTEGLPRLNRVERFLARLDRRRADAFVAVSEAVRRDVVLREHISPDRIRVIQNGVVMPESMSAAERARIRAEWGFGPDDLVFGSVANYKPRKGHEMLLRAVAGLRAKLPQMRVVLVGEGSHRPVIEALVAELGLADIVRLHGRELDARRLYGAFDVFVHPSDTEAGPHVVLEAAAAALPVIATRAGGTGEAITDGETGILVDVGDGAALAAGMLRLATDSDLRARLAAAARIRVTEQSGMDRTVAAYAALYEELAERKGMRR
jgi:glycosyltransferase involved in cell wall biosynthesis